MLDFFAKNKRTTKKKTNKDKQVKKINRIKQVKQMLEHLP